MIACLVCAAELVPTIEYMLCRECGTAYRMSLSDEQHKMFHNNSHLVLASELADGDVLILDTGHTEDYPIGPYVLTRDGKIQDVNYHYQKYHRAF